MAEEHGGTRGRRPWRGRILVLVGLLAVAFTLRTAVTSVPALTDRIAGEMFLPSWLVGILGMLPTALFGVAGLLTPLLMRAWSVEAIAVAAMAAAAAGQAARSAAPGTGVFLAGSALALAGMGAGNVVLPPMVRKYFPDRVGLLTALYVTVINVGTTVPPLLAVPVADAAGWRASLGWWAAVNVLAVLPWLTVWPARRGRASDRAAGRAAGAAAASPDHAAADGARPPRAVVRPWHSPAAWALALLFGCTSLNTYTMFAWLPSIVGGAGLDAAAAGFQLSLFAGLGLPLSLAVPVLAARLRSPFPVVAFGVATFAAGYLGLALAPGTATWLWSTLAGLGPATFPSRSSSSTCGPGRTRQRAPCPASRRGSATSWPARDRSPPASSTTPRGPGRPRSRSWASRWQSSASRGGSSAAHTSSTTTPGWSSGAASRPLRRPRTGGTMTGAVSARTGGAGRLGG
ncbi:MFS transporter [Sinomonas atrocyanea]